jgi:glyoxylase-like metal-dependent hydrolase (beta-lactamase superfamily II)
VNYKKNVSYIRKRRNSLMEIIPNVHLIPDITANPYLMLDPGGLTLVDAGLPGSQKKIFAYLAALGFAPTDLKRIIIIGGLAALRTASGAHVCTSEIEANAIASGKPSRPIQPQNPFQKLVFGLLGLFAKTMPMQVDEILRDGQVLPVLGGLTVFDTPGHTPGHISLFAPAAGILFCGDSLVAGKGQLFPSRPNVTWDRAKADESVRRQAALGAQIVCSGHGPVVTDAKDKFPQV